MTGAGKSSVRQFPQTKAWSTADLYSDVKWQFINHLFKTEIFPVGRTLMPCTTNMKSTTITFDYEELAPYPKIAPKLKDYDFTIVDTPGFDGNKIANEIILAKLVLHLKESYVIHSRRLQYSISHISSGKRSWVA